MEGINTLRDILQDKDWMGKLDLSDAYLTAPVHHKNTRFHWKGQSYQFKSLPFELANLYKGCAAGNLSFAQHRHQINHVFR